MSPTSPSERIGTTVAGRYEIRRLLGEGGFSSVFEAVHNVTGREVALKLLHPFLVTTEQITERFLMEARAMARIRHDGIVQVLDAGADPDGTVYIVLELLSGESLETTLTRVGKLTWGESVSIGIDVLAALAEAHRNKIIHRDIKPGNIFIVRKHDGSSQAKLLDFGIAHVAKAKANDKLTQAGMILGTPEYMSPEQSRGVPVGPESDLWSVGIVLFECLTGYTPFGADNTTDILVNLATRDAPPVAEVEPLVPAVVGDVIDRALRRDVTARWRSADEMREALKSAVAEVDAGRLRRVNTPAHGRRAGVADGPRSTTTPVGAPLTPLSPPVAKPRSNLADSLRRPTPPASPVGVDVSPLRGPSGGFRVVEVDATRRSRDDDGRPSTPSPLSPIRPLDPAPPPRSTSDPHLLDLGPARPSSPHDEGPSSVAPQVAEARIGTLTPERVRLDGENSRPALTAFKPPPPPPSSGVPVTRIVAAAAGVVTLGVVIALFAGGDRPTQPVNTPIRARQADAGADAGVMAPAAFPLPLDREIPLPQGVSGTDQLTEIARHAAVSPPSDARRIVATCLPGSDGGPMVYVWSLSEGTSLGGFHAPIACAGFDLTVVPDVNDDGTDEVVATAADGSGLLVLDPRAQRVWRTIPVQGARGLGGSFVHRAGAVVENAVVVFVEPGGPSQPSAVAAVGLRRQRELWRVEGSGVLARIGQPLELGLATGSDANGDGVSDVAVGMGPVLGAASAQEPRRCVLLHSGATGVSIWSEPVCREIGRAAQSLWMGPDVDGDGRGDVAWGTDARDVRAPAQVLSGANGRALRSIAAPTRDARNGFGWPVAISGDLDGDGSADILVGSSGASPGVTFVNSEGELAGRLEVSGVASGNLRVIPVAPTAAREAWKLLVADPGHGLRLYRRIEREGS